MIFEFGATAIESRQSFVIVIRFLLNDCLKREDGSVTYCGIKKKTPEGDNFRLTLSCLGMTLV